MPDHTGTAPHYTTPCRGVKCCLQVLHDHCDEVWFCKWSPNGRLLASGSKDYTVIIWELDTNTMQLRQQKTLEGHSYGVVYLAWSPDSTKLAVCGPDDWPDVWLWDVNSGRLESKVKEIREGPIRFSSHLAECELTVVCRSLTVGRTV